MTNDNQDALGLACERGQLARACYVCELEGQIQAKEALLRQAVYALAYHTLQTRPIGNSQEAIVAIRQHLDKKTT